MQTNDDSRPAPDFTRLDQLLANMDEGSLLELDEETFRELLLAVVDAWSQPGGLIETHPHLFRFADVERCGR